MTSIAALLTCACLFGQDTAPAQAQQPKPAKIAGVVVHAITGEPLRKVQLRLTGAVAGGNRGQFGAGRATTSNADGSFSFEKVDAGVYRLSAERVGFLSMQYGSKGSNYNGTPIQVREGQEVALQFKLMPQGVITGRVVDEDGDPFPRVPITVMRVSSFGKTTVDSAGQTNDIGEFRIPNLAPGKYLVLAQPRSGRRFPGFPMGPPGMGGPPGIGGPPPMPLPEEAETYAPTYFPGATDEESAAAVPVTAGAEVSGIQIPLRKSSVYHIKGRVTGNTPAQNISVFLRPRGQGGGAFRRRGGPGASARVKPDGSFEFTGVRPGSYMVVATAMQQGPRPYGRVNVDVSADLDSLTVPLGPPLQIHGAVRMEGQAATSGLTGRILLRPLEGGTPGGIAQISEDGTFQFESATPDVYSIQLMGLPQGTFLRRATLGNQTVGDLLDLSNSSGQVTLNLVLSDKAASVQGVARLKDEAAAGGQVVLAPWPLTPGKTFLVRQATTNQDGGYSFTNLPPGDYRLFAWTEAVPTEEIDTDFLKPYESASVKLSLRDGSSEQADLKVIDLDAAPNQ